MVRENRAGDVGRVWEWVGATKYIESPADNRRKSAAGRVSFVDENRYLEPLSPAPQDMMVATTSRAAMPAPAVQPSKKKTSFLGRFQERRSYF
jgi:hypothetical protein